MQNAARYWKEWSGGVALDTAIAGDGFAGAPSLIDATPACDLLHDDLLSLGGNPFTDSAQVAAPQETALTALASHHGMLARDSDPVFELSSLDGTNGFFTELDTSGGMSPDLNGDGFSDVLSGGSILFGHGGHFQQPVVASRAVSFGESSQRLVSSTSAGDVNGDGIDDVIVRGATDSFVVFGHTGAFSMLNLDALDGTNGFVVSGVQRLGDVHALGDINGDGFDDFVVQKVDGQAHVFFGHAGPFLGDVDPSQEAFEIDSNTTYNLSTTTAAGDVNGDGIDDFIVGTLKSAYVVFGHTGAFDKDLSLANINGTNGFAVNAGTALERVASLGDINGDGFADVIATQRLGRPGYTAYVMFGHSGTFSSSVDATALNGSNGFKITGLFEGNGSDAPAITMASAGDFNGDGFDDIVIGLPYTGATYIIFGHAGGFPASIDVRALTPETGLKIAGYDLGPAPYGNYFAGPGIAVGSGDVNGDGFSDVIMDADSFGLSYEGYTYGGHQLGTYVVFGHGPDEAVTRTGTGIANTIHGGDFNDILIGLGGNDHLIGGGGNDILRGGNGDDVLEGDTGHDTLIGGAGRDELIGGTSADRMDGGLGGDTLVAGKGADVFVYKSVLESTGVNCDVIAGFASGLDKFQLGVSVTGIAAAVSRGTLDTAGFSEDLHQILTAAKLGAHQAVLFTPNAGDLAGHTYLVVDANGFAGFQIGQDYVFELQHSTTPGKIAIGDFT